MSENLKSKLFKPLYWIMLLFLAGDTIDTIYRFVITGYFGEGTTFPGVTAAILPNTTDLIIFLIFEIGVIYGIYLLYNLRKIGGYWFLGSNILFLVYASVFGPIAEIGIFNILLPILLFFCVYIIFTIIVPIIYSDKFK